ncbi:MAG: hypothetical protein NXI32_27780, partial [bacterium]|nr:hypothetical protein [bacterium]
LVRATGRLNMAGQTVANFEIDYETWRGSRILEVAIRLRDLKPLADANPWRSALVIRVAWATESAILRTYNGGRRHSWSSGQTVAPALIEIDEAEYKTQYLTGGLAFHRRTEERFLETILAVDAQDVEQRVGFAVDLPQPLHTAYDFLDRRYSTSIHRAKPPQASRGWLISADVKNVLVDLERPLVDGQGRTVGVRLFLTETAGKSTNTRIRMPHNIAAARRVDFHGNNIGKLTTKEDAFTIVLRASEQCQVDLLWA